MHFIALHTHGSSNPLGITGNIDRLAMSPYFLFKDLVTVFVFLLIFSAFVFFSPNTLGLLMALHQKIYTISFEMSKYAICWNDIWYMDLISVYYQICNGTMLSKWFIELIMAISYTLIIHLFQRSIFWIVNIVIKFRHEYLNQSLADDHDRYYKSQHSKISLQNIQSADNQRIYISSKYNTKMFKERIGLSRNLRDYTHTKNILLINKPFYIQTRDNSGIAIVNDIKSISNSKFDQWLAGLIDGGGYLYVNKDNHSGFELTLPTIDEPVLRILQNRFGGSIKPRSGVRAVRYRTQRKEVMIEIVNSINGLIINNIRLAQLHRVCACLNIKPLSPIKPTKDSAYMSGLLDADGHINIYENKYMLANGSPTKRYQLTIAVVNKYWDNLSYIYNVFGGTIVYDKASGGCYKILWNSKELHLEMYDYFLRFPPKTVKCHRTFLIKEFHELIHMYDKPYMKPTNSIEYKRWISFKNRWDRKSNEN